MQEIALDIYWESSWLMEGYLLQSSTKNDNTELKQLLVILSRMRSCHQGFLEDMEDFMAELFQGFDKLF